MRDGPSPARTDESQAERAACRISVGINVHDRREDRIMSRNILWTALFTVVLASGVAAEEEHQPRFAQIDVSGAKAPLSA